MTALSKLRSPDGSVIYELLHADGPIQLEEILNTEEEQHAFVLGLLSPFSRKKVDMEIIAEYPAEVQAYVLREWHYYKWGQAVMRAALGAVTVWVAANYGVDISGVFA